MRSLHRLGLLMTAAATFFIAGCGGNDAVDSTAPAPAPGPGASDPGALAQFVAVGTSARTVNLAWAPSATAATYAVERKAAGGNYEQVALVDGRSGQFMDDGLAKSTSYSYRVVATAGTRATVAEGAVTTSAEDGIVTARGAAKDNAVATTLGAAGGRLVSADGQIALQVPAGALPTDTAVVLQTVANTAPDGRGDGLRVRLGAAPTQPLALTLQYDAAAANEADGLRVAVQRADGAWFSLPLQAIDRTARTLQAELPLALLGATAPALKTAQAADVAIEFHIVKYLAFQLTPKTAQLPVGGTLNLVPSARVRGYATEIGSCERFDSGVEACIFTPMLETRQIPFLNVKTGYARQWSVFLDVGGNSTDGTVAASGSVGAIYTAPATVPDPATVLVNFESTSLASGRTLVLSAAVSIVDDRWIGTMTAEDGPSIAGTTVLAKANVTWKLDRAATVGSSKVYRPEGLIEMAVTDDDCTMTITPDVAPVSGDTRLVALEVDESVSPASYKARLITFWTATLFGVCPKASDTRTTQMAGYGWEVAGQVGADGRIEGQALQETARISWSFGR